MKIEIKIDGEILEGELNENMNPETFEELVEELPVEGKAQTWGGEYFFRIPVDMEPENEKRYVSKGDIGYWPEGNAICLFYDETPGSPSGERIKPASPVNVVGKIKNPDKLKEFGSGVRIRISPSED